jgi:2-phospho-L-lactate guanylyltransferase
MEKLNARAPMNAILIPVKELAKAKQRLAAHFSPQQRIALADALWQDFFDVVAAVRDVDRIFVISNVPRVLERARQFGWEAIPESRQTSETDSVDFASRVCAHFGVKALLRLPVDLPLAGPTDIESIWRVLPATPATVIVPSRDGDGTNALLRTPPGLFPSHFGPGSFAKHLGEAEQCGAHIKILRNEKLETDIDDWDDLCALRGAMVSAPRTRAWLEGHGFGKPLARAATASSGR